MTFEHVINIENGIHARPAGRLAQESNKFPNSKIILKNRIGNEANASSVLKIMQLELKKNDKVTVVISGENENEIAGKIKGFFEKYF